MSAAHKTVKPSPKPAPRKSPKSQGRKLTAVKPTFEPSRTCQHVTEVQALDGTRASVSAIEEWGADPRFGRCRQCQEMVARTDVAPRARLKFTRTPRKSAKPDPQAVWDALIADAAEWEGKE